MSNDTIAGCVLLAGVLLLIADIVYMVGYVKGSRTETNRMVRKLATIQAKKELANIVEGGVYRFHTLSSPFDSGSEKVGVIRSFDFFNSVEVEDVDHFDFSINILDLVKVEELSDEEAKEFRQEYNLK